ncbi:MAG: flagellin FliC, partial [Cyanobacteria bacterium]|nr:flagellin FliC [Cyanobacteriota bacterium]
GSQATFSLQIGVGGSANDTINVASAFQNNLSTNLQIDTANLTVNSTTNALITLNNIDTAIGTLVSRRATIGAFVNRLEAAASNLQIGIENQQAAESRIRNVDVAAESSKLVSSQILQQAATSILSQANQTSQIALKLLQGG